MSSSSTFDNIVREQENLRLKSLRYIEELRIRQDKYRNWRCSEHLSSQPNASRLNGNEVRYRTVSAVNKSFSSHGLESLWNTSNQSAAPQDFLPFDDSQKHINVSVSTSAVLSDDLCSEKLSTLATQDARKKLISGRATQMSRNLNNSSSSRMFEPVFVVNRFLESDGSKAPELGRDTAADYLSAGDASTGKLNCSGTPQKSDHSVEGTPKSILRHRQIIDKNVHVDSKFDHTSTTNVRNCKHRRGLNFSYSDVDDAQLFGRKTKSVNFDDDSHKSDAHTADLSHQRTESQDETRVKSLISSFAGDSLPTADQLYLANNATGSSENSVDAVARGSSVARKVASGGLLLQTGNDRQNAKIVRELESRSHSELFSSDQPLRMNASSNALQTQVLRLYIVFSVSFLG